MRKKKKSSDEQAARKKKSKKVKILKKCQCQWYVQRCGRKRSGFFWLDDKGGEGKRGMEKWDISKKYLVWRVYIYILIPVRFVRKAVVFWVFLFLFL